MISVVVPLFNEEENVLELHRRLDQTLRSLDLTYEILFVDDGSRDQTAAILDSLRAGTVMWRVSTSVATSGIKRPCRRASTTGAGQAVVVMDGDLQDPPELIPRFLARWREGFEVVYAVRRKPARGSWQRKSVCRVLSDLERHQRPRYPDRQRRLLPDGPPRGRGCSSTCPNGCGSCAG